MMKLFLPAVLLAWAPLAGAADLIVQCDSTRVGGALVAVYRPIGAGARTLRTDGICDDNGRLQVAIEPGKYDLRVFAAGYRFHAADGVEFKASGAVTVDLKRETPAQGLGRTVFLSVGTTGVALFDHNHDGFMNGTDRADVRLEGVGDGLFSPMILRPARSGITFGSGKAFAVKVRDLPDRRSFVVNWGEQKAFCDDLWDFRALTCRPNGIVLRVR